MNKKNTAVLAAFAGILFLFSGCKTLFTPEGRFYGDAKSALRHRQYSQGIAYLSEALRLDPEYKKAILLLEESFVPGVRYYENEVRAVSGGADLNSLDRTAAAYTALVSMAESARSLPALVHPKTGRPLSYTVADYREQMARAREAAAEGHYQEGLRYAGMEGREAAKQASREFLKALEFVPGYRDAAQRETAARQEATQNVVFLPFRIRSGAYYGVDISRIIPETAMGEIQDDPAVMEYTNIVEQELVDQVIAAQKTAMSGLYDNATGVEIGKMVNANLILAGSVDNITWENPATYYKTQDRSADVPATAEDVLAGLAVTEGDLITVTAAVTRFHSRSSARFQVSYKLIDIESGTVVFSQSQVFETEDNERWGEFEGDSRALTEEDLALLELWQEPVKKVPVLLGIISREAGERIASRLKGYLK